MNKKGPSDDIRKLGELMSKIREGLAEYESTRDLIMAGVVSRRAINYFAEVLQRKEHYLPFMTIIGDMLEESFGSSLQQHEGVAR